VEKTGGNTNEGTGDPSGNQLTQNSGQAQNM